MKILKYNRLLLFDSIAVFPKSCSLDRFWVVPVKFPNHCLRTETSSICKHCG